MKTIFLIMKREYLVRVKKKSFIVMTLLTPILMSAFWLLPAYLATRNTELKRVQVVDDTDRFASVFKSTEELKFEPTNQTIEEAKRKFAKSGYDVLVYIPANIVADPKALKLYAEKNISLGLESDIENVVEQEIENQKLVTAGIDRKVLEGTKVKVTANTYNLSEAGEKDSSSGAATILGFLLAGIIYFTIFIYGAQVMRGVLEEKTNRIVEVIISSVKPFQLMAGKILGVALVGLTQFTLWILLTIGLSTGISTLIGTENFMKGQVEKAAVQAATPKTGNGSADQIAPPGRAETQQKAAANAGMMAKVKSAIDTVDWTLLLVCFMIYFVGGYLLYSALFAAIGAAVDNETDVQQFMFPITLPLILSFILAQYVVREPDGPVAFWGSMIPLTSPIIMLVRIPFGVPVWEIALSVALLVGGFIGVAWIAARIYRVGILMYGKKPTYAELAKWVFYKA